MRTVFSLLTFLAVAATPAAAALASLVVAQRRRAMRAKAAFVAVLSLLAAAIAASSASADQPLVFPYDATATTVFDAGVLCAFPVTVTGHTVGTATVFTNANGSPVTVRGTDVDTVSANGISLTSVPYHANYSAELESDGSLGPVTITGITEKVRLPDGTLFLTAGHSVIPPDGGTVIPDNGATVNLDGLCAALTP
jgi:hypothetical protein